MITYFLILIFLGIIYVLSLPITYLPDAKLPNWLINSFNDIGNFLSYINLVIDVKTILTLIIFVLSVEAFILIFKLVRMFLRMF